MERTTAGCREGYGSGVKADPSGHTLPVSHPGPTARSRLSWASSIDEMAALSASPNAAASLLSSWMPVNPGGFNYAKERVF